MSDEIPSFLDITPFGPYCSVCNESLSIQTGILTHGKKVHPDCVFKNATVIREIQRRMEILRNLHARDLSPFLTERVVKEATWFCPVCFGVFSRGNNYDRHLERRGNACCGSLGGKMVCYVTICGRVGPKSCDRTIKTTGSAVTLVSNGSTISTLTDSISQLSNNKSLAVENSSTVPTTLLATLEEASVILAPFIRPDEDVHDLTLIYYPLLRPGFEGKMKEFISFSTSQAGEDGVLFKWLEAGRNWLGNYAAGHIANVSANVRSRLVEFDQKEVNGGAASSGTFNLRRGITRLMGDLDALLRFLYRFPTTLFDTYKSTEILHSTKQWMIEAAIIPKILFIATAEEPDGHGRLPVAVLYCLTRGFSTKGGLDLVMNECGWFASRVSAVLHLLRAGVCGYLVTLSGNNSLTEEEVEIANRIQNGRVINLLAPYIKRLRDMHSRKPPIKSNTVNSNGDITSDGFVFPYYVWSTIIPRIVEISKACFEEVFDGDQWNIFLSKPISMVDWVHLEAFVVNDQSQIWLHDINVNKAVEPLIAKLHSIAELCFLGLGVGAVRHEEVIRLTVLSCQWHNSYLYFWSESLKRGSLKASSKPRLVEHRLSLTLSKIVLLIRRAMAVSLAMDTKYLFSSCPGASMLGLLQDLFDFECQPQQLNARHLFTSIGNIIMPEKSAHGLEGCLVSSTLLTEKSGHTQATGKLAYGTWLENSEEVLYDRYHSQLGETILEPPPVLFTPFSQSILIASLKELVGRKAVYRSEDQQKMIEFASNSVSRHSFVGLPCGHGKGLSWMVPVMASYLSGRHVGLRIIVLPYKFLLGHIVQHAISMLGLLKEKLTVEYLDSSQISVDSFPDVLESETLPSLLFVNLDGAATLFRHHLPRLQSLAHRNILKRVYLDEFQQLIVEYCFRPAYQSLREVGRLGVPVMCLSGSLPFSISMSLMAYCGLTHTLDGESLDVVKPTDPVGDGFSFDVSIVKDIPGEIIKFVLESRVGACHVLCSSKPMVESIKNGLSSRLKVLSITGDSSYLEQMRCAKSWFKGEHDVLVSTVVGLVGNENKFCRTIVVGGFLFNVSSLVQAIGRLRPTQRGSDSTVKVFRVPFHKGDREEASAKSDVLFNELKDAGCLNDENKELYVKLFAPIGLQELLSLRKGCYLQELSSYFGFPRLPCTRCGLCVRLEGTTTSTDTSLETIQLPNTEGGGSRTSYPIVNPYKKRDKLIGDRTDVSKKTRLTATTDNVEATRRVSEETSQVSRQLQQRAKWVFSELMYRCMICGSADCNGELCLKGCYRCGDRYHQTNSCAFSTEKLSVILANKGVCFGCYDTLQHKMSKHDMIQCPLKRRLRRLLFLDRHRQGGIDFEEYIRRLYSSELIFVSTVAAYSKDTILGKVWNAPREQPIQLDCIQMDLDSPNTPLLPPDLIENSSDISVDGTARSTKYRHVGKARAEYNRLRSEKLSVHRQRQFVFGAIYETMFQGYFEVNPLCSDYNLAVTLPSNKVSTLKVRLVSPEDGYDKRNVLRSVLELGRCLSGPGNARGVRVGDKGSMHAIGLKSASSKELYKTNEHTINKAASASTVMREWLEDNLRDDLREVIRNDSEMKVNYPSSMPRGPGSRMMVSVNLANSPHYDKGDTSRSIGIWVEEKPGQSENWYFVLPNVSHQGSQGLVIKLAHGVVITWDGREIYHCTSKTTQGDKNKTYGCMWGSSRKK